MSKDANQADADLIALFAAYDESVRDNALFRQTVHAAVQAALSGKSADEVLTRMSDIPDAHPGMPEACRLLLNACRQKHLRELRRDTVVARMTAVRKGATATVAWVAGLDPDIVSLDPDDDIWLLATHAEDTDRLTTWFYWASCSVLVGVALAQAIADDNGGDVANLDPDLYDGEDRAFNTLKGFLSADVDMDNLCDYAKRLADWVRAEAGFHELTEVLLEKGYLDGQDFENLLTQNGLGAGSLRFHDRSLSHVEIGLEAAMGLPANDPSMVVYVSKTRLDSDDAPLQPLGVPIRC